MQSETLDALRHHESELERDRPWLEFGEDAAALAAQREHVAQCPNCQRKAVGGFVVPSLPFTAPDLVTDMERGSRDAADSGRAVTKVLVQAAARGLGSAAVRGAGRGLQALYRLCVDAQAALRLRWCRFSGIATRGVMLRIKAVRSKRRLVRLLGQAVLEHGNKEYNFVELLV